MSEQIQEDLAPFSNSQVCSAQPKQFVQEASPDDLLVYIKIHGGRVYSYSPAAIVHTGIESRLKSVHEFFQTLAKDYKIPNVDFVLTLHDALTSNSSTPIFAFAKSKNSTAILLPDFEALIGCDELFKICDNASQAHPWKAKKEMIFWRGATTGGSFEINNFLRFPRAHLVFLSRQYPEWLDAAFTAMVQSTPEVYDFILANTRPLAKSVPIPDHFLYKYLIDVDGNTSTYSRCRWILMSNSVLLKPSSENIQWYYKALQPWIHYVPVQADYEDLPAMYEWLKSHDAEALQIALQGESLARTIFQKQEIQRYVVTLLTEYSKLMSVSKAHFRSRRAF
jgi:protein glucosyltransferase